MKNFTDFFKKIFSKENAGSKKKIFAAGENLSFDFEKTDKIWEKYFRFTPLKLVLPLEKYRLGGKKVLDVGSAWGEFLIHFGRDSKGIEVLPEMVEFSKAAGLDVEKYNFENEWHEKPESFDAVWCSNVLEHVVAPHRLLRKFHGALKKDGLVFIRVPVIPSNRFYFLLNKFFLGFLGYESLQHINAFTRKTIEFAIERAGFEIIESNVFLPPNGFLNKLFNPILKNAASFITVVARKIPFEYPEKRPAVHNPEWLGRD